ETVKQAMINKQPFEIEYRLTHRDGTIRYFLERGKPVLSEQGDISHIDGVIFDITSRKQVEELLRQSRNQLELQVEERTRELVEAYEELKQLIINREQLVEDVKREREVLQKIIDNIPVMLCFYDSSGEIRMINREFVHRLGWSVEQLRQLEDPMAEFYPDPEYRKEVWEYMMEASPGWRDFRVTTAHGGELESSWANVRLSDNSQIGIGIDVTESKVAEKELLAYQDRLRSLSSELSLIEERERRKLADDLHDSVAQLLVLAKFNLEDVLAKSPLGAGRTEIEEVCQYLDEAMKQTRSLMFDLSPPALHALGLKAGLRVLAERIGRAHNLQVDFSADEIPLGALDEDASILLYRSVQELLMNIVKHAKVSRAKLSLFKNGDAIRVEVKLRARKRNTGYLDCAFAERDGDNHRRIHCSHKGSYRRRPSNDA
ncbi:MAG: PAS domain S-box protein, partial [Deltaproteobacteria bacterium]